MGGVYSCLTVLLELYIFSPLAFLDSLACFNKRAFSDCDGVCRSLNKHTIWLPDRLVT